MLSSTSVWLSHLHSAESRKNEVMWQRALSSVTCSMSALHTGTWWAEALCRSEQVVGPDDDTLTSDKNRVLILSPLRYTPSPIHPHPLHRVQHTRLTMWIWLGQNKRNALSIRFLLFVIGKKAICVCNLVQVSTPGPMSRYRSTASKWSPLPYFLDSDHVPPRYLVAHSASLPSLCPGSKQ